MPELASEIRELKERLAVLEAVYSEKLKVKG